MNLQMALRLVAVFVSLLLVACGNPPVFNDHAQSPVPAEKPARNIAEVLNTLQAHATQIYQIYTRELVAAPGLRGKIVVVFMIAPNGKVVRAQTASSELHRPVFEDQILSVIRGIDFGVQDVKPLVATYPIDFAPS